MNLDVFYVNFEKALLVFARFSGIFIFAPVFGATTIPVQVKAWITVFLTLAVFPLVRAILPFTYSPWLFGITLLNQVVIGLIIGFIFSLILIVFQLAGQIFSFNMGFGIINTFDPASETEVSIMGQFMYLIALAVFVVTDAHHTIIYALDKSFRLVPIIMPNKVAAIGYYTMMSIAEMFRIAAIIAAPILGTMIVVELALGILARVAPQMNIFIMGFSIKILVGFFLLLFLINMYITSSARFIDGFYRIILEMIKQL